MKNTEKTNTYNAFTNDKHFAKKENSFHYMDAAPEELWEKCAQVEKLRDISHKAQLLAEDMENRLMMTCFNYDAEEEAEEREWTPYEKRMNEHFQKLLADTEAGEVFWETYKMDKLNNLSYSNGSFEHPLFKRANDSSDKMVFESDSFGMETKIINTSYSAKWEDKLNVYLMEVCKASDPRCTAKEVWVTSPDFWDGARLAMKNTSDSPIAYLVDALFSTVANAKKKEWFMQNVTKSAKRKKYLLDMHKKYRSN